VHDTADESTVDFLSEGGAGLLATGLFLLRYGTPLLTFRCVDPGKSYPGALDLDRVTVDDAHPSGRFGEGRRYRQDQGEANRAPMQKKP
jgi:hypothetical protein